MSRVLGVRSPRAFWQSGARRGDFAPRCRAKGAAQIVVGKATVCLALGSLIDLSAEKARLEKAIAKTEQEIARIAGKLSNEKFVANANPDMVAAERERLGELEGQNARLKVALARICVAG
ncbi:MAG: hypothetical protein EOS43_31270 [Mesorhizobium sp.]|nr:MAG: hypothetical protein EOS43_31270 [Mesorhizobium sp.]